MKIDFTFFKNGKIYLYSNSTEVDTVQITYHTGACLVSGVVKSPGNVV